METFSVLHICNDFLWTRVHRNLYAELDRIGVRQHIFTPLRKASNKSNNRIDFTVAGSSVRFSGMLKSYHRLFFKAKIRKLLNDLEAMDLVAGCDIVHATTLFSDGALAYALFKKYGTPYIVSIRNTDINAFLTYKPYLIFLAWEILQHADKLVFISQSNYDNFFEHALVRMSRRDFRHKALVINNGVDRAWLDNIVPMRRRPPKDILFIGHFDKNKNALHLIAAFLQLSLLRDGLRLHLVGGGGALGAKVQDLAARHPGRIVLHGVMTSTAQLMQICRECDVFAMVSHHETFGLVYIEALTQGLPILYTRKQGIDGTFSEKVGIAADPGSVADIAYGLARLIDNHDRFELHQLPFERFDWEAIAARYASIYRAILAGRRPQ